MQILNSGSFIHFENKEKIDQLIFTAKELANSAVGTEGFVNQEESNKRLALEIWKGAEYMCRDHEEAQIKNIFINNFLERLREICGTPESVNTPPQDSGLIPATPSLDDAVVPKDEFDGVVSTEKTPEQGSETCEIKTYKPGNKPHFSEHLSPDDMPDHAVKNENFHAESNEFRATPQARTENESEPENAALESSAESVPESVPAPVAAKPTFSQIAISSITLTEKEPYQFDKCTVTATIQLLPAENGIRKTIVSVRTHDFAPQISSFEITGGETPENILPALEKAFEKYRNDLPIKAIDKLKKEKAAGKKQTASNHNLPNPVAKSEATAGGNTTAPTQERGIQGGLFG